MTVTLWYCRGAGRPQTQELTSSTWLTDAGPVRVPEDPEVSTRVDAPEVVPIGSGQGIDPGTLAVVLVPDGADGTGRSVTRNRGGLGAGLHLLRHGDEVQVAEARYWLAFRGEAAAVPYDPRAHGEDLHCRRTRLRIKAGDRVVVCPGVPGRRCGLIYLADAWATSTTCTVCGFDPRQAPWEPPGEGSGSSSVVRLLQRLAGSARREDSPGKEESLS